jgi:hypothetical protein
VATMPATGQRKPAPEALIRTSHPGVYRRGHRSEAVYRRNGRQHKETVGAGRTSSRAVTPVSGSAARSSVA